MKKALLFLLFAMPMALFSQSVTLDYETPETSNDFQIFGGNLEGVITNNITNPAPDGVNGSTTVLEGKKASDAPDWGGMFTQPSLDQHIDGNSGGTVCFDIWTSAAVPILCKLENEDATNVWELSVNSAGSSAWENMCFDLSMNGNGGAPASGTFSKIVLFYDFGTVGNGSEQLFYLDNISYSTVSTIVCQDLFNFEPTSPDSFSTFGATDTTLYASEFIIANPGPDAVNGSAMVMEYTKQAGAATWAGMFFDLDQPVDANLAYEVCVDYWSPTGGDLLFKIEKIDNPSDSWENLGTSNSAGGWETICYDLTQDDIGGGATGPATGRTFDRMVLFANFGTEGGATDEVYYFDNILVKINNDLEDYDVSFSVDMNGVTGFTQPYVSGTFNNWSGDANPMDDADGDGIWEATLSIEQGQHEYKFTYDNWAGQEDFTDKAYACTVVDPSGQFVNRSLVVTENATEGTYCFNSCFACGAGVTIEFNLGQGNETVDPAGFHIAGGGNFGVPGDNPMTDNGDGSHTIRMEREVGFSSHYTFTNGACPAWDCKEDIAGQACADPANFNDRFLMPVTQDTVLNTCFGLCSTDLLCGDAAIRMVTYAVDMNNYAGTFTQVYMSGTFNGWSGDANPMDDADGDGVWETTLELIPGMIEYKFTLDNWAAQELFDDKSYSCTVVDPSGQFVNRSHTVSQDETVGPVCFNSCYACGEAINITINLGENGTVVDPAGFFIAGGGNFGNPGDYPLTNDGDGVHSVTLERNMGFESYYTFTNGACPDYSCKEDIAGQECADPDNFNDRYMGPFTGDAEINTCFGSCMTLAQCTSGLNDFEFDQNIFEIRPSLVSNGTTQLYFGDSYTEQKNLTVINNIGQVVFTAQINGSNSFQSLDLFDMADGIYFVNVTTEGKQQTQRIVLYR